MTTLIAFRAYICIPMNPGIENTGQLTDALKSLGLTRYEAQVYIGLLQFDGASATEIHEISGVPRASVYPVLDKLVHKGLVIVSNAVPKRFEAISPKEGILKLKEAIKTDADFAGRELEKIYMGRMATEKERQELIWSISGSENIINKLKTSLNEAESQIQIIADWDFIRTHILEILLSIQTEPKTDIITENWEGSVPKGANVRVVEDKMSECFDSEYQMSGIYIIDSKKVLVIMSSPGHEPSAMFSESTGFINFFTNYWRFISYHLDKKHTIKVIEG